jgi:hypothetical protein
MKQTISINEHNLKINLYPTSHPPYCSLLHPWPSLILWMVLRVGCQLAVVRRVSVEHNGWCTWCWLEYSNMYDMTSVREMDVSWNFVCTLLLMMGDRRGLTRGGAGASDKGLFFTRSDSLREFTNISFSVWRFLTCFRRFLFTFRKCPSTWPAHFAAVTTRQHYTASFTSKARQLFICLTDPQTSTICAIR